MTARMLEQLVFWLSLGALVYTYFGYPALVALVSRWRPHRVARAAYTPTVSVVIAAYNEERDLAAKLENTLALDYPKDKLEVIVASDCSTDGTDEVALSYSARGVRLHRQRKRLGKTAAQNAAVMEARGEIILFSDATSHYRSDVLRAMMPNFADPTVGCVAGRLIYVDPSGSNVGRGARSYWNYETRLKRQESLAGSLISVSGCLYAVRRAAYVPLPHDACSDFVITMKMVEQGLRTVYEPNAVCTEKTNRSINRELHMRVRIIAQTLAALLSQRRLLNPRRSGFYAVQLVSHKFLRYMAPLFLMGGLITSAMLGPIASIYHLALLGQIAFYTTAVLARPLEQMGIRTSLLALPQYFVLGNLASLLGILQVLRGERYACWESAREEVPEPAIANPAAPSPVSRSEKRNRTAA